MRADGKDDRRRRHARLLTEPAAHRPAEHGEPEPTHVVFDFTGLRRPDICDLSLILTARLQASPGGSVWVRSLPWQTARVLRALGLDHLFRHYPTPPDQMN